MSYSPVRRVVDKEIHAMCQHIRSRLLNLGCAQAEVTRVIIELPPAIFDHFVAVDDKRIYELHGIKIRRGFER